VTKTSVPGIKAQIKYSGETIIKRKKTSRTHIQNASSDTAAAVLATGHCPALSGRSEFRGTIPAQMSTNLHTA
jgi:hypothetical protein